MLPDVSEVTFNNNPLMDPVKFTETGAIELPVVEATVGKLLLSTFSI